MAATLDHLSGGRLILGIGAGWHDPEYEAFGYPTDHRVGRFEEALAVITGLIRDGRADLDGRYVTARDAVLLPPARPDLPILIAVEAAADARADGPPRRRLEPRLVRAADERLARVRGELLDACARVGRDPATLTITVGITVRYPTEGAPGPDHARPVRDAGRHRGRSARPRRGRRGPLHRGRSSRARRRRSRPSRRRSSCSARADRAYRSSIPRPGQTRTVAWRPDPAELEEPDDPGPLSAVRLEQLEHPGIVAARLAGQRERDEVRQVEVADADRVVVAERPDADLGRGPRADPGNGRQPGVRLGQRQVDDRLEPGGPGGDPADEVGAPAFDAERVIRVVGQARRGSRAAGAEAEAPLGRAGRRLAVRPDEAQPARGGPPGR